MQAPKVIHSFQLGEILVDGLPFKKGFVFNMWDDKLELWKAGKAVPVSDSYCDPIMIDACNIRAYVVEHIKVERDLARN